MNRLTMRHGILLPITALLILFASAHAGHLAADQPLLELRKGDHIAIIGNTLADRMQHDGWLDTLLHARFPEHDLVIRNLGFAGDELKTRPRSDNFGSADQWLTRVKADVIFCFFGYNEALRGEQALAGFRNDLVEVLTGMQGQQYNGESTPRIVVFSPIAHENLHSPHLPDGSENNSKLKQYTAAMAEVCGELKIPFVDLFEPTQALYQQAEKPLTMNGVHLLPEGGRAVGQQIDQALFGDSLKVAESHLERIRAAVLDRNFHWFSRYRVIDEYNVFGGRSKLAWDGLSNADVMQRELEIFDVMTANREKRVWAVAQGGDLEVKDDNLPPLVPVKTNKPGPLEDDKFPYLGATEAIDKMQVHEAMEVNLFASEEMFPELINPVQIRVDTDSRLWASVWPSYPHWNPTKPLEDKLIILEDEDGDGVADKCTTFADELNSITGFEFWGGGVLVAAPPEVWFLKDTTGDDKADFKLRVLQGLCSADTHHTANALRIGPDGWLYWSRGVFHVTNMETPTKTFRSTTSGVYRFNPRTFEMEFHFPIGPNPHGHAIDRWGFQFVNDGTSGTGNYMNIGKGIGNKQWFEKRVRPVAANGMLSSSHFPEEHQGNFLICNTIGFLGVLQHEMQYNGADIRAEEVDPIVVSADPNFRPSDIVVGGDGALYVADWCNAIIGHMQHNMRDPNRDDQHGRIYRVTYPGRPLVKPAKMKGKPIAEVCQHFFAPENDTRYRARLELSGRETSEVVKEVGRFAASLDPRKSTTERDANRDEAQALLECLWVFQEHRVPNLDLLRRTFQAEVPGVRAAAIRTLGHWAGRVDDWQSTLLEAARDESALVRAEAVKAAVNFGAEATSAEVVFEVMNQSLDPELETVLKYARDRLKVDQIVRDTLREGKPLSPAAQQYALRNATVGDLVKMPPTEAVYLAVLSRPDAQATHLDFAIKGLAETRETSRLKLLLDLVEQQDTQEETGLIGGAAQLLLALPAEQLQTATDRLKKLSQTGKTAEARQLAYAAWITADRSGDAPLVAASRNAERLGDFLAAVPQVHDESVRKNLFPLVRPLLHDWPASIEHASDPNSGGGAAGLAVDYFLPSQSNVRIETLAARTPTASGIGSDVSLKQEVITERDAFALRFTSNLAISQAGRYTFHLTSDDGSRLYLGGQEVIDNDGLHGMVEKSGSVELAAGSHPLIVTYFDNGGGDGLSLRWSGPGIQGKQPIPAERFSTGGGETLHDVAIAAVMSLPGHESEKFMDLATVLKSGRSRASAVRGLASLDKAHWDAAEIGPLVDSLMAYLSQLPASGRTSPTATDAIALARSLSTALPQAEAEAIDRRLKNLDVRVIAIGTVPHRMIYDQTQIVVEAGKPIEFRLSNSDHMPHNLTVVLPGSMQEVGELADSTAMAEDAMQRQYVPESDKIILASQLLQPGQSQAISFEVPTKPGVYPIVCTYPGHWRRMYAALYVVESLDDYRADAAAFFAKSESMIQDELLKSIGQSYEWTMDELADSVKPLTAPRSYEVGLNAFKVASCVACHKVGDEGVELGPDLTKLEMKKQMPEYILRSLLDPSADIDEKYQSYSFALVDGKVVTGMIVEETSEVVKVIENPLASGKPLAIPTADIEERVKSTVSIMPQGLLGKLTREEILDLIGFVHAGGDKKHKVFGGEGHEHHGHNP
ncbi:MAG: PVC-type heme-binding CxxCH protein [Pirellulaceae bacterium]